MLGSDKKTYHPKLFNEENSNYLRSLKSVEGVDDEQNRRKRQRKNSVITALKNAFRWKTKSTKVEAFKARNTNGKRTTKDEVKPFQWYTKSTEMGDIQAGIRATKDEVEAFEWYLKSAESGDTDAQFNLDNFYGPIKDEEKVLQRNSKSDKGRDHMNYSKKEIDTTRNEEKASTNGEGGNDNNDDDINHSYDNEKINTNDHTLVSSAAVLTKAEDKEFLDFTICANIWTKLVPVDHSNNQKKKFRSFN